MIKILENGTGRAELIPVKTGSARAGIFEVKGFLCVALHIIRSWLYDAAGSGWNGRQLHEGQGECLCESDVAEYHGDH